MRPCPVRLCAVRFGKTRERIQRVRMPHSVPPPGLRGSPTKLLIPDDRSPSPWYNEGEAYLAGPLCAGDTLTEDEEM